MGYQKYIFLTSLAYIGLTAAECFSTASYSSVTFGNYGKVPSFPKTVEYNGFAENIVDCLPECAKSCVEIPDDTVCPDYDVGCLCFFPAFNDRVASCWAESCSGTDVMAATNDAINICNFAGASTWSIRSSASSALASAASNTASSTSSSTKSTPSAEVSTYVSTPTPSSTFIVSTSIPTSTSTSPSTSTISGSPSDSTSAAITVTAAPDIPISLDEALCFSTVSYNFITYATYGLIPSFPKEVEYNGWSDNIIGCLPECAKSCVEMTADTVCPPNGVGCNCLFPSFNDRVASCWAESCSGTDVIAATNDAINLCNFAGASTWSIGSEASSALESAASTEVQATTTAERSIPIITSSSGFPSVSVAVTPPLTPSTPIQSMYENTTVATGVQETITLTIIDKSETYTITTCPICTITLATHVETASAITYTRATEVFGSVVTLTETYCPPATSSKPTSTDSLTTLAGTKSKTITLTITSKSETTDKLESTVSTTLASQTVAVHTGGAFILKAGSVTAFGIAFGSFLLSLF